MCEDTLMAAGFDYSANSRAEMWSTEDTPVEEDPVQKVASGFLDSSHDHEDIQMDKDILEVREQEQQAHKILKGTFHKIKDVVKQTEELVKSFMAEADETVETALETSDDLEQEKLMLISQLQALQDTTGQLEGQLNETRRMYEEKVNECDQERQAHNLLKEQFEEMKEELLKCSMAEAHENVEHAEDSKAQQEQENISMKQMKLQLEQTLQDTIEQLDSQYQNINRLWKEKLKESKEQREAYNTLQEAFDKMNQEHRSKLQRLKQRRRKLEDILSDAVTESELKSKECEQERKAYVLLMEKFIGMEKVAKQKEELLQCVMAEAEERVKNALDDKAQLEQENSTLTLQIQALQATVEKLERQHHEKDQLKKEKLKEEKQHTPRMRTLRTFFQRLRGLFRKSKSRAQL